MVSIVMPVFGDAPFIGEAISSVLTQSYDSWELLICLDGPNPNARRKITAMGQNFRVLESSVKLGATKCRNFAIEQSAGTYIATLDCDDLWPQDHLKKMVKLLESSRKTVLAGSGAIRVDENGRKLRRQRKFPVFAVKYMLLFRNPYVHSSTVMRKSALAQIKGYDESFGVGEDYDLWMRLAAIGKICFVQFHKVTYRIHDNQWTSKPLTTAQIFAIDKARIRHANNLGVSNFLFSRLVTFQRSFGAGGCSPRR